MSYGELVPGLLLALFCGALIGVERELGKLPGSKDLDRSGREPSPSPAGLRTHVVAAFFGGLLQILDARAGSSSGFVLMGLAVTSLLAGVVYGVRAARTRHWGVTSAFTLVITYVLGVLSLTELRLLAAAMAVAIAAVLAIKVQARTFLGNLRQSEVGAAIQLGLVTIVLLPLIPDRDFGPADWEPLARALRELGATETALASLAVFNPFKLWVLVVAISAIGFAGYVLIRSLGPRRGLTITGFVGGLVSSTAVTLSMAEQSKRTPGLVGPFASAVLAASTVMAFRVIAIALALAPGLALPLTFPMAPMLLTTGLAALFIARRGDDGEGSAEAGSAVSLTTPFALLPALKLTALFFLVRIVGRVLTILLGGAGLVLAAFAAGIVDVDAITAAVAQESVDPSTTISERFAVIAIFTAVATNTLVKAGMIFLLGSRPVGRAAALWLVVSLVAGGAGVAAGLSL